MINFQHYLHYPNYNRFLLNRRYYSSVNETNLYSGVLNQDSVVTSNESKPNARSLNILGFLIDFDGVKFYPSDVSYTPQQLLATGVLLNDLFVTINEKGYIPENVTTNQVFTKIEKFLSVEGFKFQFGLASSENSYTI